MTEQEWLMCDDPVPLFRYLDGRTTERKLRLFATATLRSAFKLDQESQRRMEIAEKFADGMVFVHELRGCWPRLQPDDPKVAPEIAYDWAESIVMAEERGYYGGSFPILDQRLLSHLIRDVVGNPFRLVTIDAAWLTPTVLAIARQAYEDRDFSLMPILGDALEDAGCGDPDILGHCRKEGEHVRGCWVVDMILGKV